MNNKDFTTLKEAYDSLVAESNIKQHNLKDFHINVDGKNYYVGYVDWKGGNFTIYEIYPHQEKDEPVLPIFDIAAPSMDSYDKLDDTNKKVYVHAEEGLQEFLDEIYSRNIGNERD